VTSNPDRSSPRHPWGAAVLALALLAAPACAQSPAKDGEQARAASGTAAAGAAGVDSVQARATRDRVRGSEQAPVTIVEVSDFQCPFCRQFTEEAYKQIDSAYIRPGRARIVFVAYPIPQHAEAWGATEAALCAGAQGKFWPMHDRLFAAQREWSGAADAVQRFAGYARALQLDMGAYQRCVEEDQVAPLIVNDVMQASGSGISGTPTFIINGQRVVSGAAPFEEFRTAIDAVLAGEGVPRQPGADAPQPPVQAPVPAPAQP
jgi:protein-disulfide isomerase